MANTYSKILLQVVFAVKNRNALLDKEWRSEVFSYMAASLNQRGNYSLAVNGYNDHVHLFFDYKSKELIQDIVREIKKSSNHFINEKFIQKGNFEWQTGYGVFSHGFRERGIIIEYITNQEEHHSKRKFKDEYLSLLENFEIEFKNEYLFDFLEQ